MTDEMRTFGTGATRHSEEGKFDYEGFLSPLVLRRYAKYMDSNRVQADGQSRSSDNWQKGIPLNAYMKSMWRHFMDLWVGHRRCDTRFDIGIDDDALEAALCAILFNASGYLHEMLAAQLNLYITEKREEELAGTITTEEVDLKVEDCMPPATKEELDALGTGAAAKAIDKANDPRYVLTPEGWVLPTTQGPLPKT